MSEKLIGKYQRRLEVTLGSIEKFKAELDRDPAYALTWGTGVFQAAAEIRVVKQVIGAFENGGKVEDVRSILLDHVLHRSKYPPHSTSPTSNLLEQYELAAYAEILSELKHQ